MEYWIQLAMAAVGALGFSLLFKVRMRLIPACVIGATIVWIVYCQTGNVTGEVLTRTIFAAGVSALWAEYMAKQLKAPATIFLITALIPLIPGSSLYYTMYYATLEYWQVSSYYGRMLFKYVLGIAIGVSIIQTIRQIRVNARKAHEQKKLSRR